ncbi:head GIN domain-containing protein [Flammeovirga aprica]|uniref:DUF2807 domain-containing protein n=1 Tax=Flammeovirga aprica JL-4 TaxID=694437 RepID=A0A7X9RYP5_9BACT|nr:head GIN domain-containing protein [Flammeovirga aprica]NME71153.1 DUF2807 domain-containing protein [Flammeovirga aprica JL-4]
MRNLINFVLFALLTVFTFACQEKAEGPVLNQEISVDYFNGIEVSVVGHVIVEHGTEQKVTVTSQQNVINALSLEVVGGKWKIKLNRNIVDYDFTLHITTPEIEKVDVSGSANVTVIRPHSPKGIFESNITGSGNVEVAEMNGIYTQVSVNVSGSGTATIDDIVVRNLYANVSGSGKVMLSGMSSNFTARVSGSGSISDFDLVSSDVDADCSGAGSISFTCIEKLKARVSGSGNIFYKGNPVDIDTAVEGSGKIEKVN